MNQKRPLGFSIDFEGFVEGMEESFPIPPALPRFAIEDELQRNADRCFEVLARHDVRATFFVVGWIAKRFPALVRRMAACGHEVGSHSMAHQRLWDLPPDTARVHIRDSKIAIEDAVGAPVLGFRAPDCSLTEDSPLMDCLAEAGYRYDSSVNPTNVHDVYGAAVRRTEPWRLANGLVEVPIPTVLLLGKYSVTVGSGGYFRLFPYWLTRRWLATCPSLVSYLHPYEIGGVVPAGVQMSPTRRVRHLHACGRLDRKLAQLFSDFAAMPVADYLERTCAFDRTSPIPTR